MRRVHAVALVAALALGACSGDDGAAPATTVPDPGATTTSVSPTPVPTSSTTTARSGATTTTRAPVRGGTLTVGTASALGTLDPALVAGDGDGGGTELAAIYDVLVRFDPDTGTYVPRLAASVLPNADATVWTIALRAGVTFSDGAPFDAAAVKAGIDRHRAVAAPTPVAASTAFVREVTVLDARTLTVALTAPWAELPWLLSTEVGMIPSPTAGPPVGAGPFTVASFEPGGTLVLRRNDRWYGGSTPLDGVRFVPTADHGGARSLDALLTGSLDAVFLRDQRAVRAAGDKRLPGRAVVQHAGSTEILNLGGVVAGRAATAADLLPATRFLRVRLAIAAAIDPAVVSDRVAGTRSGVDGDLVGRGTDLWPRTDERTYDPELARRLVAEARANGWDGRVRYLCDSSTAGQSRGIAVETMLEAAGIDVTVDTAHDAAYVRDTIVRTGDFDVACGGFTNTADAATDAADGTTLASLTAQLASRGVDNRSGWSDARVDAALLALRAARTSAERRAAVRTILDEVRAEAPFVVTGARTELLAWTARVHGVVATSGSRVLLDGAFVTSGG